jgi:acyl carrier protein
VDRAEVVSLLQRKALELLGRELGEADAFRGDGIDSLAVVELVMDVEDELGVELAESEVVAVPDLGGLADVIVSKRA